MKAQEVLRRYAAGERDFRGAKLRGANFKGKDLSGADFSEADIRSADFSDATLRGVIFQRAKAGLQRRWMLVQLLVIAAIAAIAGLLQAFAGALVPTMFNASNGGVIGGIVYLFLFVVIYLAIAIQGFTNRAFGSILGAFAFAFAFAFVAGGSESGSITVTVVVAFAFASVVAVAGAFAFALVGAIALAFVFAFAVTVASTFAFAFIVAVAFSGVVPVSVSSSVAVAVVGLFFSAYIGWQVLKENEKFDTVWLIGLSLSSLGGTSFSGADLTGATFKQAELKNTDFANSRKHNTCLTHVCWNGAQQLNQARVGNAILQDKKVRTLLTTPEKGYKQDLVNANLRGANLSGVTLERANLTRAILSEALLKNAVLKDAILTEAQAVGADFTNACLTGATLESWNIDSTTVLDHVDCEYVYLLEKPKNRDDRERRPHDINKVFEKGDFEKLFKEVQDDVQILIRNGVNPIALRSAFQKIREEYPDLPENAFQGFQRRDEDVLVTVKVPPEIDKSEFERNWDSGYQAGLQAGREESAALLASVEQRASSSEALALALAQRPVQIYNNQNMTLNDRSQKIEIKGNADGSVIGQGDDNHLTNRSRIKSQNQNED